MCGESFKNPWHASRWDDGLDGDGCHGGSGRLMPSKLMEFRFQGVGVKLECFFNKVPFLYFGLGE